MLRGCALLIVATIFAWPSSDLAAQESPRFDRHSRSRGLLGGWAHSWRPAFLRSDTSSDITFIALHPQMGWFVTDRLELYGEGTLFGYLEPQEAVSLGIVGLAGRYHFRNAGRVMPYVTVGAGFIWTTLDVPEIDRLFNFQIVSGVGVRLPRARGAGVILEVRTHHISNAGTKGSNLGVDALTLLAGVEWILR